MTFSLLETMMVTVVVILDMTFTHSIETPTTAVYDTTPEVMVGVADIEVTTPVKV